MFSAVRVLFRFFQEYFNQGKTFAIMSRWMASGIGGSLCSDNLACDARSSDAKRAVPSRCLAGKCKDRRDRECERELERAFRPTAQSWQAQATGTSRIDRTPSSPSRQSGNLKEE